MIAGSVILSVVPDGPTDLGFTRDRHYRMTKSPKADLVGAIRDDSNTNGANQRPSS
jgi:hypothetical protein